MLRAAWAVFIAFFLDQASFSRLKKASWAAPVRTTFFGAHNPFGSPRKFAAPSKI